MPQKHNKDAAQWVMLINDEHVEGEENSPQFCKLRHPKSGRATMFLFSHGNTKLSEVTQFKEDYGSWFIDQTVQQDGALYMTTPVNPAFLVLPYLIKAEKAGKFRPLDQVVTDEDYPECHRLCQCDNLSTLDDLCDVKGTDDFKAYKYNQDKTLKWLTKKVESLSVGLEREQIVVCGGARAANFVHSDKSSDNKADQLRYAHGLLSDYLPDKLAQELKTHMGIKDPVVLHNKPPMDEPKSKRAKTDKVSPSEDYSSGLPKPVLPAPKLSQKQKQLSKVDKSGMKSISSFFSPKPNKAK